MPNLKQQLEFYQGYHRTRGCRATHVFGIPLVTFGLLLALSWLGFDWKGWRFTLAMPFVLGSLGHYWRLDRGLAWLMLLAIVPLLAVAHWAALQPMAFSGWLFAATFGGGWILQLIGHAIEGRKPALLDNFAQAVFTAPLFLLAEGLIALGRRADLGQSASARLDR